VCNINALVNYAVQKQKRRHSVWVRGYLKERTEAYNSLLMKNLRQHDTVDSLRNYEIFSGSAIDSQFRLCKHVPEPNISTCYNVAKLSNFVR